ITGDDGKDYFVHISGLEEGTKIFEGDKVEFDAEEGDKGPKAVNVKKVGSAEPSREVEVDQPAAVETTEEPAEEAAEPAEETAE
ncbi:MAG: cold-shock protein, partial [Candidatus Nanoarchaeia archaeon]